MAKWTQRVLELVHEGSGNVSTMYDEFGRGIKLRVMVETLCGIEDEHVRRDLILRMNNRFLAAAKALSRYHRGSFNPFLDQLPVMNRFELQCDMTETHRATDNQAS